MKSSRSAIIDRIPSVLRKRKNYGNGRAVHRRLYNDEFFRIIADNVCDIIFQGRFEPDFHFEYVSPSCTRITGYIPEDFYTDSTIIARCIHPDDYHLVADPFIFESRQKGKPVEVRWKCKNGKWIWTEHNITVIRNKRGKPESCLIIARDITERKKAEEALLETQKFNETLLANAPHAAVVIDADSSVRYVNPAWEKLNGWTAAEVIGIKSPNYPWWPDQFREMFAEGFKEALNQPTGKGEVIAQKKNGELYWIEMNWDSIMKDGKVVSLLINSIDITDRKRMEEKLVDEATRRRILIEQSRDGIVILNQDGSVYEANHRFAEMLGYTMEEALKLKVWDWEYLYPPEQVAEMIRTVDEAGDHFESKHRRKDGSTFDVEISTNGAMFAGQKLIFCVCRDITERNQAEAALKEMSSRQEAILAAIPDIITEVDINKRYTWANKEGVAFFGDDVIGKEASFYFEGEQSTYDTIKPLFIGDESVIYLESWQRRRDGEKRLLAWWCRSLKDKDGNVTGALSTARDITEHKKADEALRESEKKFSTAFNASPFSISISRLGDGKFIEVNEKFLHDKGYTREEIIGHSSKDFKIWANQSEAEKLMKTVFTGGRIHNQEVQYQTKSGQIRTGLVSIEVISIANEPCMLAMNSDITQQKMAQEQLRLLGSVTQQVSDATVITDPKFKITYMNQAAEDLFGYKLDEARGKSINLFNEKPISAGAARSIIDKLSKDKVWTGFVTKKRKDGSLFICDCHFSPLYDEKGQVRSYIDVQRDVTLQQEVEAKLQEHKKLIDSILATMPEGVLVIDRDNNIILANKAFSNIFHISKNTLKNKKLNEILPAEKFFNLHKAVESGELERNSLEFRYNSQGFEKIIGCIIVKMDGDRKLLTFSDISKGREEEEKLYLTDRLVSLGEMAAGLAHELNNPLTGILALSQMLISSNLPEEHKEDMECINSEAKRAAAIVKNVLLFARNKTDISGRASINDVVTDILRLREYEEKANNIKVVTQLEENLPEIPVDKGQLQQVFLNFISNAEAAIKETNRPGVITVATQRINSHVNIIFSDNGCGIKKDIMSRIFDPFFTTKEIGKGTGLGLSICYSIIVKHGGKISVKSQVNEGTTFTIKMPVVTPDR
jgi:PAS domain S-box-containing protein